MLRASIAVQAAQKSAATDYKHFVDSGSPARSYDFQRCFCGHVVMTIASASNQSTIKIAVMASIIQVELSTSRERFNLSDDIGPDEKRRPKGKRAWSQLSSGV